MKFKITVSKIIDYTPADLMLKYADNYMGNGKANRYIATENQYGVPVLYDQQTAKAYEYDRATVTAESPSHITLLVHLKEIPQ